MDSTNLTRVHKTPPFSVAGSISWVPSLQHMSSLWMLCMQTTAMRFHAFIFLIFYSKGLSISLCKSYTALGLFLDFYLFKCYFQYSCYHFLFKVVIVLGVLVFYSPALLNSLALWKTVYTEAHVMAGAEAKLYSDRLPKAPIQLQLHRITSLSNIFFYVSLSNL